MARIRTVKPAFFDDEKLGKVSIPARLLFIGLLVQADDYGVTKGHPHWLHRHLFPYDDFPASDLKTWIEELVSQGFILSFNHNDEQYFFIKNFLRHQKISKRSAMRNPEPPQNFLHSDSTTGVLPEQSRSTTGVLPEQSPPEVEVEVEVDKEVEVEKGVKREKPAKNRKEKSKASLIGEQQRKTQNGPGYQKVEMRMADGGIFQISEKTQAELAQTYYVSRSVLKDLLLGLAILYNQNPALRTDESKIMAEVHEYLTEAKKAGDLC